MLSRGQSVCDQMKEVFEGVGACQHQVHPAGVFGDHGTDL